MSECVYLGMCVQHYLSPLLGSRYAYYMWVWQGEGGYRSILETEWVGRSLFVASLVVFKWVLARQPIVFHVACRNDIIGRCCCRVRPHAYKRILICQTYPLAIKNVHLINAMIHVVLCNPRYQMSAMWYLHASMYLPHTWNHITLYGSCY